MLFHYNIAVFILVTSFILENKNTNNFNLETHVVRFFLCIKI